jgi:hypothetical protein
MSETRTCDECGEPLTYGQKVFDYKTHAGTRRTEHATCRKARTEGFAVGSALVERNASLRADLATLREAHTETADALARSVALVRDLRAEVENAEEASKLASRIVAETIARAEKAEAEVTRLRAIEAAARRVLGGCIPAESVTEWRHFRVAATIINELDTALAAGERE